MTKRAIRDVAPARGFVRAKLFVRFAFVGATAWAMIVFPHADRQAAAQSRLAQVRIHNGGPELYRPFTRTCASALIDALTSRNILNTRIDELGSTGEIEALPQDHTIIDIDVLPTGVGLPFTQTPQIASLVENYSPFRDVAHFQAFLYSRLYEAALNELANPKYLNDPVHKSLFPKLWIGWAYAGTTQLFTADTPLVRPSDLSGRTLFSEFSSVSLRNLHSTLGFAYNAELAHAPTTFEGQSAALSRALDKANRSSILIAQPLVFSNIIPDAYKRFVALANWHIMTTSFELRRAWDHADQIGDLQHIVRDAALDCSRRNLDMEIEAIDWLKLLGSTIVPVDTPAFHALTLQLLKQELDEAVHKETIARQAWDRKSAEIEKSKRKAAGSKQDSLSDFDDDPTSNEEQAYNDAVRDSTQAKRMLDLYNQIQELR